MSSADVRRVSSGCLLVLGVAVPLSGWWGERFGLTRVFTAALIVFTAASGLCAIAWNLSSLIVFRVPRAFPAGSAPSWP